MFAVPSPASAHCNAPPATRTTTPSNPSSLTSRLLPPPRMKHPTPRARAKRTADSISSSSPVSTNQRAAPPTPSVVYCASDTFS